MRVLIFHGYLLRGTGSNVYNSSLARALAALGHEVHLLCQDRDAGELDWVSSVGGAGKPGAVTVHNPDIHGLLPVYVADSYAGFEVKTFAQLTDSELERYIQANVTAVRAVVEEAGRPGAALANHLVMGPAILARAGLGASDGGPGFAAKVHGSALEYTVKPEPERFLPYAREGMEAASAVLVGSRHTAASLWDAVDLPGLEEKTRLGPPGVDVELFAPAADRGAARERVKGLIGELEGATSDPAPGAWGRDPRTAAVALEWFAAGDGPRALFVGKLIVSKGVDLLLAAWPLMAARHPDARLLIVGFGEYREGLERLWSALTAADAPAAADIAARGRGLEGGKQGRLGMLADFLAGPAAASGDYYRAATATMDSVRFAGRLEHDEVADVVPVADALVFPSTFPEAFGMVAAEAAAAGALPIGAAHSGIAEVSRELAATLPDAIAPLVSFPLGGGAVEAIAARLDAWFSMPEAERAPARAALRETVARLWSWEGVAKGVIAASERRLGDLARLPPEG
ncbi:MAG: glycosyltransferase [Solirubrobacterales bacterium]